MKRYDLEQGWNGERATMEEHELGEYVEVDDSEFKALVALAKIGRAYVDLFISTPDIDESFPLTLCDTLAEVAQDVGVLAGPMYVATDLAKLPEGI